MIFEKKVDYQILNFPGEISEFFPQFFLEFIQKSYKVKCEIHIYADPGNFMEKYWNP